MLCNSWPIPGRGRVQRGRAEEPTSNGAGQVCVVEQCPLPPSIGMLTEWGSPWLPASLAVSDSAPGLSSELGRKGHLCHPISEAVPALPSMESSGSLPISVKSSSSSSSLGAQLCGRSQSQISVSLGAGHVGQEAGWTQCGSLVPAPLLHPRAHLPSDLGPPLCLFCPLQLEKDGNIGHLTAVFSAWNAWDSRVHLSFIKCLLPHRTH